MLMATILAWTAGAGLARADGGPIFFTKGIMVNVKPEDKPASGRVIKKMELIACPGEFEPFSLAIHGTADGGWMFEVSDLKATDARASIPASAVETALVWWQKTEGHLGKGARVTDFVLDPAGRGVAVTKGKTSWVWLTVHVPGEAKPGLYQGTFTLKGEKGQRVSLPLEVEVLPVKLGRVPGVQFCLLYPAAFGQYHNAATRAKRRPAARKLYLQLKNHGMTCIAPKGSDWPYKPGHFEGLAACVELAKEVGLTGPVIWYMSAMVNAVKGGEHFKHYDGKCDNWNEQRDLANLKEIVQAVQKLAREKNWPEIVFATIDEPGTQTENLRIRRLRLGTITPKTLKVVHELGARACATISEPVDNKHNRWRVREPDELRKLWDLSRPYCDIRIYAYGSPQGKTNLRAEKADCEKRGHEMWFYHNPAIMRRDRYCARLYFGLWGWKVGAQGLSAWTYPGGRTVQFELVREGIDDLKYLATIERLLKEKRGSEQARKAAEAFLARLKAAIKLNADGYIEDWAKTAAAVTAAAGQSAQAKNPDFAALKRRMADVVKSLLK
ncbi:MAG: hypothetical protein B1H04_00990 [Planctomycetales bacterium 4484_123]|nr:MAG: hypothetical protein B1H04_00990 [Planctomycetales bacterium 4484_123]